MARGIIYVMTTVVPGLIKIGKTGTKNYEDRMYQSERNGYSNVVGLKRHYAIEVDDYDDKEILLDDIFSKSRLDNTELFALDVDLVVQLLSSFEGRQVYPENESKEEVFDKAAISQNLSMIPNGLYTYSRKCKGRKVSATTEAINGRFFIKAGSDAIPLEQERWQPQARLTAKIENGKFVEDIECNSPSTAGRIITGLSCNGWLCWKNKDGDFIDVYRKRR